MRSTNNSDYRPSTHQHTSHTELSYTCGLGRRFSNDNGTANLTHLNYTYTCSESVGKLIFWPWNTNNKLVRYKKNSSCISKFDFCFLQGEWSPDVNITLPPCIWIACIYAPVPPDGTNLTASQPHKILYNGTEYERNTTEVVIGQKVEYHCFNGMRNRANPSASVAQG